MSKNKIFTVIVLVSVVPQVAFASWWNPTTWTWFKSNKTKQVQEVKVSTSTQPISQKVSTSTVPTKIKESDKSKDVVKNTVDENKKPKSVVSNFFNKVTDQVKPTQDITNKENKTSVDQHKEAKLLISSSSGGSVVSKFDKINCNSNESCQIILFSGATVTLTATPNDGYKFVGWKGGCEDKKECTVTVVEDSQISALFEPLTQQKITTRITSLPHPESTCYIKLGRDYCNVSLSWTITSVSNIFTDNGDAVYDKLGLANKNLTNYSRRLGFGPHTLILRSKMDDSSDTVKVNVECTPGSTWDGTKCWTPKARTLSIIKSDVALVTSSNEKNPDISCGSGEEECRVAFPDNTKVTLTAIPNTGYIIDSWNGDCVNTGNTCSFIITKDSSVGTKILLSTATVAKKILNTSTPTITGDPVAGCTPNWKCDGWSACLYSKQTRYCYDENKCNSLENKPQTSLSCVVPLWNLKNQPKEVTPEIRYHNYTSYGHY